MYNKVKKVSTKLWSTLNTHLGRTKDVYFISGMCYNCSVFDAIQLPKGYKKHYIEWKIPLTDESLEEYALRMSECINPKRRNILVGYSFGGVLIQEIAKQINTEKIILISSMKSEEEIPSIFHIALRVKFFENLPARIYNSSDFMINLFNRYIYEIPTTALEEYMTMVDPEYLRWSLFQITHWIPDKTFDNLYHIHGTKDQVFPYEQILNPITIKGGDHLMIIKRSKKINAILNQILTLTGKDQQVILLDN